MANEQVTDMLVSKVPRGKAQDAVLAVEERRLIVTESYGNILMGEESSNLFLGFRVQAGWWCLWCGVFHNNYNLPYSEGLYTVFFIKMHFVCKTLVFNGIFFPSRASIIISRRE